MKTLYFIRHSKPGKCSFLYKFSSSQVQNEKTNLTKEGKILARKVLGNSEFDNVEEIYSSNYLRAYQTAKELAKRLKLKIIVLPEFGERKIGMKPKEMHSREFEHKQFNDNDYKLEGGESLNEVRERECKALINILNESKANNIAIFFHATAMMTLLKIWCDVGFESDYYFNGKSFFDGKFDYCEAFKLIFDDDNQLIDIKNINNDMI